MENNWVKILSLDKPYLAEIIKGGLLGNNIPAVVVNKKDSLEPYIHGSIELYVEKGFKERAIKILKANGYL